MDQSPHTPILTHLGPLPGSPSFAPKLTVAQDRTDRDVRRLQFWRQRIEDDGYQTMLSVVSPCGLIVRDRRSADRWLALAPDRSLVLFQRDESGHVRCEHRVIEALGLDSEEASALVASAAVHRFFELGQA
jgi:hypothetical protein